MNRKGNTKKKKSLIGAVKLPENFDEDKARYEYLIKNI
jgi:hypothetical protein